MIIFITACEPSGDRLGAQIIATLKKKIPQARFLGVAGPLMRTESCEAFISQENLAVMGFVEVLKQLPRLLRARKKVAEKALSIKPDLYIGIDAPDFNLKIETQLKSAGIKTVHVNSPTIWAWRKNRIKKIKRAVDLMLTLFPFETAIYDEYGIPAQYIGHPLADEIPLISEKVHARQQLGIVPNTKVLSLMPGSRHSELKHLAPVFCAAAKICFDAIPDLKILAPMVNEKRANQFKVYSEKSGMRDSVEISIGNAHQVLQASDAVLIASGTATLEAMLCKTPMVVAYKADTLSFWIARKLVKIPHVSLPNILAGKAIVPEFLQEKATPEALAQACLTLLQSEAHTDLQQQFEEQHLKLKQDAAEKAADIIEALLKK